MKERPMTVSREPTYVTRSVQWGELRGMRKLETVEQMTPEYRETVLKIVYALASTEFASVEQHQPWINQGPTAEDRFVQAQIAADEAHQGMEDYRLLVSFGPDGEAMARDLLRRRRGEHLLEAFNLAYDSWADLCMFCCTMDLVAWYHLKAFENSSFAPFARAMYSMVPEERFHASFGANRVRRLVEDPEYAAAAGATRADVEAALRKWYPRSLDTFGGSKSKFSDLAVRFGIRRWGNEELRQMYLQDINPTLRGMGLEPPEPEWDRHVL
jgi:1,2-phenylacetyl-CoA epoxidase catalytic subunit